MNRQEPTTTVVIVTYNSRATIGDALTPLQEAHQAGLVRCVVVDNASADDTAALVRTDYPWVELICSPDNLGYGRGCNLGCRNLATPYVLILNPDAVVDTATLQTLVDFMTTHERAGIVAPAIIEGEKSLQAAGLLTTPLSLLKAELGLGRAMPQSRPIKPGEEPFQTPWVCGAVMLIRSDLFQRLGGFDPRFFLYFEETDLCRRAALSGAEIWAVGQAVVRHVGGSSAKATGQTMQSSCIADHYYRSRFYYLVKHFGWFRAIGAETALGAIQCLKGLRRPARQCSVKDRPFLRFPAKPKDAA